MSVWEQSGTVVWPLGGFGSFVVKRGAFEWNRVLMCPAAVLDQIVL